MIIKLRVVCIVMCCLLLCAAPAWTREALPPDGAVDAAQGMALVKRLKDTLYIVDVRSPEEFQQGHIPEAHLLPLGDVEAQMQTLPADHPLLIVCRTGRRAKAAYEMVHKARPDQRVWYLRATPRYEPTGYRFE